MTTAVLGLGPQNFIDELCNRIVQDRESCSAESLRRILREHNHLPAAELLEALLESVNQHCKARALTLSVDEYRAEFREYAQVIDAVFGPQAGTSESDVQPAESTDPAKATRPCSQDSTPVTPATVKRLPQPEDLPNKIGRYPVKRRLGKGGNGQVYLAWDTRLKIDVAVKVPHSNVSATGAPLREAATLAQLNHPNIVRVFGVEPDELGRQCVAQEFIDGQDLAARLAELGSKNQRMEVKEAAELVAAVADALAYLHRKDVIHRDIKPANILLDKEGQPHLADFGWALLWSDVGTARPGGGTPLYIAPEQLRDPNWVNGSCDIFSLGAVLYEALVGEPPFSRGRSSFREILANIDHAEARPPRQVRPEIPVEIERICLKALAKDPAQRYSSAADMAQELRAALRPRNWPRLMAGALAGLLVVFLGLKALWPSSPPPAPVPIVGGGQQVSPATNSPEPAIPTPPPVALKAVDGNIFYRLQENKDTDGIGLPLKHNALPLAAGDQLFFVGAADEPAYFYVYRLDEAGSAHRMWPLDANGPDKVKRLQAPSAGQWWDVGGQPGFTTVVIGATLQPLTADELKRLDSMKRTASLTGLNDEVYLFYYPEVERNTTRSGSSEYSARSSHAVLGECDSVLQSCFQAYHGWIFSHQ